MTFDLHEELALGVRDAAGAWAFIRRFTDHHARPIVPGDGYLESELDPRLPASLRAMYALFGRRDDLTRSQDRLLAPADLAVDDTGTVLVFRTEAQNCAEWGIPLSALSDPDPPVVFRRDAGWQPFLERVSLACVEMVLTESMLGSAAFYDNRDLDASARDLLERHFRRLPFPDYPMWADPSGSPIRWFAGSGAVLREDAGVWLWAYADSPAELAAVRHTLPGDWLLVND